MPVETRFFSRSPIFAIVLAITACAAITIFTSVAPIKNERSVQTSIFSTAPSSDLKHYMLMRELYFEHGVTDILKLIAQEFYGADLPVDHELTQIARHKLEVSPPLFPALIWLFDYREGNTVGLAVMFLVLNVAVAVAWITWLQRRGLSAIWLIGFAFLPHPLWFTINLGTDYLFYASFTLFFLVYYSDLPDRSRLIYAILAMLLATMVRPTGMSLLVFLILDQITKYADWKPRDFAKLGLIVALLSIPLAWFFWPYFVAVIMDSNMWPFFGTLQTDYLTGIYDSLPPILDLPLSWLSLLGSKFLYLFGMRPSYSNSSNLVVFVRALPGLLFLPGFVYLLLKGSRSEKILVFAVIAPVLAGPAQDRYLLPLQPLLFYYAWALWRSVGPRLRSANSESPDNQDIRSP